MKPVRYIVDTTLRDGEQTPGLAMSKEQKIMIAEALDDAGIHQIEAGTPAMGSYEIDTVRAIMAKKKNAKISVWNRMVAEDIEKSAACAPDIIHISAPISDGLIFSKLKKNKTWVADTLAGCVEYGQKKCSEVTVGFEDASRADIEFICELSRMLRRMGVRRVRFADTVGVMSPSGTYKIIREIIDCSGLDVELHMHNDLGMAVANSLLGAKAGAIYIDTTVLGLGERAGNCNLAEFTAAAQDIFNLGLLVSDASRAQNRIADIIRANRL